MTRSFRQLMSSAQKTPQYWEASAALDVAMGVHKAMQEQSIDTAELSRRLRKSKRYVTQVLRGDRRLTLKEVSQIALTLGYRAHIDFPKIEETKHEHDTKAVGV